MDGRRGEKRSRPRRSEPSEAGPLLAQTTTTRAAWKGHAPHLATGVRDWSDWSRSLTDMEVLLDMMDARRSPGATEGST